MKRKLAIVAFFAAYMLAPLADSAFGNSATARTLDFDVYLDDAKIGWHRFDISSAGAGVREVRSEARFDVRFLFITAFRYRHENSERWVDGCLAEIDADTNSNGKRISVTGERNDEGFVVEKDDGRTALPNCVMTFAYWNPDFLKQARLLNPQTGEYLDVEVEKLDTETLRRGDDEVEATAYAIRARGVEVTVWYSPDDEWLALESQAKGGRTIRYELS